MNNFQKIKQLLDEIFEEHRRLEKEVFTLEEKNERLRIENANLETEIAKEKKRRSLKYAPFLKQIKDLSSERDLLWTMIQDLTK